MAKAPVAKALLPLRVGMRFVGVDQGDKTLVVRNPLLVGSPPERGLVAFFGRLARPVFGEETRLAATRGERVFPVTATYVDTTGERYRVVFEREDYPRRRWLDLRHMRLPLAEGILSILGVPQKYATGNTVRLNLTVPAIIKALRPTHIERRLPAIEEWLGTSLDLIVFPGTTQSIHVTAQAHNNPPDMIPVYAWVIRPETLVDVRSEDADRQVVPLTGR